MFGMRMPEILLILVIVLVIFGAKSLPKLGSSLGQALRGLRRSAEGEEGEKPALAAVGAPPLAAVHVAAVDEVPAAGCPPQEQRAARPEA